MLHHPIQNSSMALHPTTITWASRPSAPPCDATSSRTISSSHFPHSTPQRHHHLPCQQLTPITWASHGPASPMTSCTHRSPLPSSSRRRSDRAPSARRSIQQRPDLASPFIAGDASSHRRPPQQPMATARSLIPSTHHATDSSRHLHDPPTTAQSIAYGSPHHEQKHLSHGSPHHEQKHLSHAGHAGELPPPS